MHSRYARPTLAFVSLLPLAACSAAPDDHALASSADLATCPAPAACTGWGATCIAGKLTTCMLDASGCATRLEETCSLGCEGNACRTCDSVEAPARGETPSVSTAYYRSLVRAGTLAFAAWAEHTGSPSAGFAVVDLSNPDAPTTLASVTLPTEAQEIRIHDGRLYVLAGGVLTIWDVSTPASPAQLGTYEPTGSATSLVVTGSTAVVGTTTGLELVDVSTPTSPKKASVVTTSAPANMLALSGSQVVVGGNSQIDLVDIADRASPKLLASASLPSSVSLYNFASDALAFDGQHVFALGASSYNDQLTAPIEIFQVTTSGSTTSLSLLTTFDQVLGANHIALDGTRLLFSSEIDSAVGSIDVSTPAAPKLTAYVPVPAGAAGIAPNGSLVDVAVTGGVQVIDLARAGSIEWKTDGAEDALVGSVAVGSIGFVARASSGLVVENLQKPAAPVTLASVPMAATSIAVDGGFAYLTVAKEGLRIYDVHTPSAPVLVGSVAEADLLPLLGVGNGRAYAMASEGKISIFDVSVPAKPSLLLESDVVLETLKTSAAVDPYPMRGSLVFLVGGTGVTVVDLATPTAPVVTGEVAFEKDDTGAGQNLQAAIVGSDLVVSYDCVGAESTNGLLATTCLQVFDVSNPASPAYISTAHHPVLSNPEGYRDRDGGIASILSLFVSGTKVYLPLVLGGVGIIDLADPANPKDVGEVWTPSPVSAAFVTNHFLTTDSPPPDPSSVAAGVSDIDQVTQVCK